MKCPSPRVQNNDCMIPDHRNSSFSFGERGFAS